MTPPTHGLEPAEAQALLALLTVLGGSRRTQAAHALGQLLDGRLVLQAAEVLLGHSVGTSR